MPEGRRNYVIINTPGRQRAYTVKDHLLYCTEHRHNASKGLEPNWELGAPVVVKSETLAAVRLVLDHIELGALD